jgi:PPOX class probable F420-dependent enzyme
MPSVPEEYRDLFDKKAFAAFATVMGDGSPQVTPVWFDREGDEIWVNTAAGRQKHLNVKRDPRVALTIMDPDNPYRYIEIRGTVREITELGADASIDKLAQKYLGEEKYPWRRPGEQRVILKIQIERVSGLG